MKNTYIVDTNVLISDPEFLTNGDYKKLIIPLIVLEELDKHKSRIDIVGRNSRKSIKTLKEFLENGSDKVEFAFFDGLIDGWEDTPDNRIISIAKSYKDSILLTNDFNVFVKCKFIGIKSEVFKSWEQENFEPPQEIYTGIEELYVDDYIIDSLYRMDKLDYNEIFDRPYLTNQFVTLVSYSNKKKRIYVRITGENSYKAIYLDASPNLWSISPKNLEQMLATDLLLDPSVSVVSLVGLAGTGKTLMALASGLQQIFSRGGMPKIYQQMIVTRPIQTVGKDMGYLPGTAEEKMGPWIGPIYDNLEFLENRKRDKIQRWFDNEKIVVEAMAYIRGRSIPDSFMIIDESQNLSAHEIKTILTRIGQGTKVVLTGDVEQIDNPRLSKYSNGMTYMIEKFKGNKLFGHVLLTKSERSEVAELAAKVL